MNCDKLDTELKLYTDDIQMKFKDVSENNRKNGDKLRKKIAKNRHIYNCTDCSYRTSNKYDYEKHCKTRKHLKKIRGERSKYTCTECKKAYTYKSSYLNHVKTHNTVSEYKSNDRNKDNTEPISNDMKELLVKVLDENKKLQDKLIDIAKEPRVINNNNQKTTINVIQFLNTECNNAVNFSELINTLEVSFADLELIEERGYIFGMQHSLIKVIDTMDVKERPIHCTDPKRGRFFIRHENVWNKDSDNSLLEAAVETYNNKQLCTLSKLKQANPGWIENDEDQKKMNTLTQQLTIMERDSGEKVKNRLFNQLGEACSLNKQEVICVKN